MADHGPVKIREGRITELIALYEATYKKLAMELAESTTAGKIQKLKVMARINSELESLGVQVNRWIEKEIPQYYLDGANQAVQDLRSMGVEVTKASGMAVINREAIKALTDETALTFAEGIRGISRNARRILDDATKLQINLTIAEGLLTGDARQTVSASIRAKLADEGLTAVVDRSGRKWTLERYAEMLVRTKGVEARNQGLANRMLQNGYDLVQVTNHGSTHAECARWEGKVLSISGKTPRGGDGEFAVAGTVEEARSAGLFHPNCKHAINVINPELASLTQAYDNPYNYRNT